MRDVAAQVTDAVDDEPADDGGGNLGSAERVHRRDANDGGAAIHTDPPVTSVETVQAVELGSR